MRSYLIIFALLFGSLNSQSQTPVSFSLKEAQEYAVQNSYSSQVALMDVEKSKKRVKEITAIGLPQVDGSVAYQNFIKLPVTVIPAEFSGGPPGEFQAVTFGTDQNMTADITGRQLIFDGSYIVGLQAAKTYLELSKNNQAKNDVEIKNQVAQAYYVALAAEKNASILTENAKRVNQIYKETKALYESGFLEEQDADQIKLNKMNLESSIKNANRQVKIAANMLKFQMGIPIADSILLSDKIETLVDSSNSPSYVIKEFDLNNHIDFRIAQTNVKAGELTLKNDEGSHTYLNLVDLLHISNKRRAMNSIF